MKMQFLASSNVLELKQFIQNLHFMGAGGGEGASGEGLKVE